MAQNGTTLVFYPSPLIGHLISMVELAKHILNHHPCFSIIFLITTPQPPQITTSYIHKISTTTPSITFHHLQPHNESHSIISSLEDSPFNLSRVNNSTLYKTLQDIIISHPSSLKAFILDFFCNSAFDVGQSLDIPTYYYWTTSASGLTLLLHLPYLDQQTLTNKSSIHIPDMPSIPWCDAPPPLTPNSSKQLFEDFMSTSISLSRCKGIILNTFDELESRALKVFSSGVCTPNVSPVPMFCVGPLIGSNDLKDCENECLVWLSSQPRKSVVFLCFGSMGLFSVEQLREMGEGLERSGYRFLWVVRNPSKSDEVNLDELLPKGFLERTKDWGLVVKSWAPQKEVLSHDSIGGFVTHCGWNSILEAVCGAVPMVGWPLYAEQRMNRVFLVEEMKVTLPLDVSEDGLVESSELERRIRELMDPNSVNGDRVRKRVMMMKNFSMDAMGETGSSRIALDKLALSWLNA